MKIKKTFQGELPENRIVNTYSDSLTDAYSANYLNDKLRNVEVSSTEPTNGKDIWVQMGKNLFDKNNKIVSNFRYDSTGELVYYGGLSSQEAYISVKPNTSYIFSAAEETQFRVCEYDKNKNFLIRNVPNSALSCALTTGPSTEYVRLSFYTQVSDSLQIEEGEFKTDYEPYISKKIYVKKDNKYELVYDEATTRKEIYIGLEPPLSGEDIWIRQGYNLYNDETMLDMLNNYRRFSDGLITGISGYQSIKVPVKPNTKYRVVTDSPDYSNFTFYTKDFTFISGMFKNDDDKTLFETPDNCYFVCIAINSTYTQIQISESWDVLPYQEYVYKKVYVKNILGNYDLLYNEERVAPIILWENKSPSSEMGETTLVFRTSDYDYYEVLYRTYYANPFVKSTGRINKGSPCTLESFEVVPSANVSAIHYRPATITSAKEIVFYDAYVQNIYSNGNPTAITKNNKVLIPVRVLGYKN